MGSVKEVGDATGGRDVVVVDGEGFLKQNDIVLRLSSCSEVGERFTARGRLGRVARGRGYAVTFHTKQVVGIGSSSVRS